MYSWLASTGMGLVDKALGGNGIQLVRAALTCALAALAWRLSRPAVTLAGRLVAVTVVLVVGNSAWTERPLLPALVFMALVVLLAEEDRGSPWLVVPIMWLWVNVHGSFPLALVYLGVRLAGRRLDKAPLGRLPALAGAAVVGTLAGAVNPLGPRLLVFPLELLSRHDLLQRVVEWRTPNFSRSHNLVLLGAVLVSLWLCSRARRFEDGLVVLVFGAAATMAVRNLPVASIVVTPVLARALANIGTIRGERRSGATVVATAALVGLGAVMVATSLQDPAYDLRKFPVRQLDWMEAEGLLDRRVATQDFVGNLITARRGTRAEVFFDDRYDMYPERVIRDAIALLDGTEGWQQRLDAYRVDTVLWQRSKPLAGLLALDPRWRVVRRDKDWIVAVRR